MSEYKGDETNGNVSPDAPGQGKDTETTSPGYVTSEALDDKLKDFADVIAGKISEGFRGVQSQTDKFDTPYNYGIPKAYHRDKANHWHVKAETVGKSKVARIAAVMAVFSAGERFQVQLQKRDGWFGATAEGDFGQVEGWIRIDDVDKVPAGFPSQEVKGRIDICGRSRDGKIFLV